MYPELSWLGRPEHFPDHRGQLTPVASKGGLRLPHKTVSSVHRPYLMGGCRQHRMGPHSLAYALIDPLMPGTEQSP